ncbi:MAG: AmmeMemoRadiSam system radical SAM enzyme [Chloroflexi bacterium]|nr:AmmeMemoRadiSam system radical SAM enzyme [Chloroflexota bacterium]
MGSPFVRDSLLQEPAKGKVNCHVCERRCTIVAGGSGWCRTRTNRGGKLIALNYGSLSSVAVNPVEKKPFYHLRPGSMTLTAGSWSCNFGCPWCQNWNISKVPPPKLAKYSSPERFVEQAEITGCEGTSISFNEPTLSLEWSLDVFRLARRRGLYNSYVTNGYMTWEALSLLIDAGLDAMNVDVKGDDVGVRAYCKGIDLEKVWATCKAALGHGVHIEITTLVIPTVNDTPEAIESIARRIVADLGREVPWHLTAYYPAYRFTAPPTPMATLERAWQTGIKAGLKFVYVGNHPGHRHGNTYCPDCGELLIRRFGFEVLLNAMYADTCPRCGRAVPGRWSPKL